MMDALEQRPDTTNDATTGITRRRFVGYLVAAPTLLAAADLFPKLAWASVPTVQIPTDGYDLTDLLTHAAMPTSHLITVGVNSDGSVSFSLPRAEVGQGITTAIAMIIADEMGVPLEKVRISLSDARPELHWNQLTGGSNTIHSMYTPVRVAAAIARGQLVDAAAEALGVPAGDLQMTENGVAGPNGVEVSLAELSQLGAVTSTKAVEPTLKAAAQQKLVGTPQKRVDGRAIVTGKKVFAMDLNVPNALPTMICRPPTINGRAVSVRNLAQVKALPGITDVAIIAHSQYVPGGVAVRGRTFGHCIHAITVLDVEWAPGTVDDKSDEDVLADLKAAELPMEPAPPGDVIDQTFTFHFRPGDPLETNSAVADVRSDHAEVWSCLKSPIWFQETLATNLGLPIPSVVVHVTEGGGSFGRHLFADAAFEAAEVSRVLGKPVKLMWHRTDNFRQGRVHPMATSHVRIVHSGGNVLTYDQRHTSVATDFRHGLGELFAAKFAELPQINRGIFAQGVFLLTANVPYDFGAVSQLIDEIYDPDTFNTSSVRNIYSPDVCAARELMIDRVAKAMAKDPLQFRREFLRDDRLVAVLDAVAKAGKWGRAMTAGTAQGIAVHREYKGAAACLVEIDCRPATVGRRVPQGYTGPRVTKAVFAVDVGLPINPLGLQAQMMGGIMDAIAQALTYSLHLKDGSFLEGSWDDAYYTRQWNTPPSVQVIVMPPTGTEPGGAGELGVAASMAAVACAYARATGKVPTSFPINHDLPLTFDPMPTVPPIPDSPTDGLQKAF
ncbi:MAG: isoquinoline 1-oxidoreductase subunit beta [Candidatus Binatota bacterium]|nr:isoquinoline 1-oxidoreductase subunit beta [Candidatus Binatota bacterium]